jgi:hypothetical protein
MFQERRILLRRLFVFLFLLGVAIALTLAFAAVASAAEVKSENGNTVAVISGEGGVSGGTTLSAGSDVEAVKHVEAELHGAGSVSYHDSGYKSANDDYVTVEINCDIVSAAATVTGTDDGFAEANASVYAKGGEDGGEVWVEAGIKTSARTSTDTGSATAVAKASGWAKAYPKVGGSLVGASISASAEGTATSNATCSGDSSAENDSYIKSYAELDPDGYTYVYDWCSIYSDSDASGDKALASGTAQGKADASATAGGDGYDWDLSSTTHAEGRLLTQAAASGDGDTDAYAQIYAQNEAYAGGYEGYWGEDYYYGVYIYDYSYLETDCHSYSESDTYLGSASALAGGMATSNGSATYSFSTESTVTTEATSNTSASGNVLSRLSQKADGYTKAYAEIYAENAPGAGEGEDEYDNAYVPDNYSELYTDCYAHGYSDSYLGSALAQAQGMATSSGSASYTYTAGTVTETAKANSGTSAQGKLLSRLAQKAEGRTDADAEIYAENTAGAYYCWDEDFDYAWAYGESYLWTECWTESDSDNYVGSALTQVEGSASSGWLPETEGSASYSYTTIEPYIPALIDGGTITTVVADEASAQSSAQGKILNRVSQKADGYTDAEAEIYGGSYEGGPWAEDGWYDDEDYYYYYAYADGESYLWTYCEAISDSESFVGAALVQAQGSASSSSSASYTYTETIHDLGPVVAVINPPTVIVSEEASADTSVEGKAVLSRLAQKSSGSTETGAEIYAENDAYADYDDIEGYDYYVYDDSGLDAYGDASSKSDSFVAVALSLAQGSASSNGSADYNYYLSEGVGGTSDTSASGKLTAQLAQQAAGVTHADGIIESDNEQPDYNESMGLPGFYLDIEYASMFEMSRISTGAHAYGSSELYKGTAVAQAQGETSASGTYGWYSYDDGYVDVERGTSDTEASGKTIMARAGATMLGHADALAGIASLNLVDAYGYITISIVSPGITVAQDGTEVDFGYDGYGAVVDLSFFGAMTETSDVGRDTATALATAQGSTSSSGDYSYAVGEYIDDEFVPDMYLWEQSSDTAAQGTAMARSQAQMAESNCLAGAISVNIAGFVDMPMGAEGYWPTVFDLSLAGTESYANGYGQGSKASAMGTLTAATSASGTLFEGYIKVIENEGYEFVPVPDLALHSATIVGATLADDGVSGLAKATSLAAISGDATAMAISGLASGNGAQNWQEDSSHYLGLGDLSLLIAIANASSYDASSSANAVATATGATTSEVGGYYWYDGWESEGWSETTASGSALSSAATTGPAGAGSTAIIYSYGTGDDYYYELADQSVIALDSGSSVGEGGSAVTKAVVNKGAASANSDWWFYGEPVASSDTSVSGSGIIAITNKLGEVEAIVNVVAFQDVYFGDGKSTDAFAGFGCGVWATDGSLTYSSASVTGVNAHAYADGAPSEAWVDNGSAKALLKPNVNYGIAAFGYDLLDASGDHAASKEYAGAVTDTPTNEAIAYAEAGAGTAEPVYLPSFPFWGF